MLLFREINASSTFVEAAARRRPSKRWRTVQVSTYTQNSDVPYWPKYKTTLSFSSINFEKRLFEYQI